MKFVPVASRQESSRHSVNSCNEGESEYTAEDIEFGRALDRYKKANRRPFPTWSEVLEVARCLGYRKILPARELPVYPPQS